MGRIAPIRCFAGLLLLWGARVFAQDPAQVGPPVNASFSSTLSDVAQTGQMAQVSYNKGLLEIAADNSSLNQILEEIARLTGMKITGGVKDERVYGKYGPSTVAGILASLLDGTGSNMLLRETASNVPTELILTPREGGPTPPQPQIPTPQPLTPVAATPSTAPGDWQALAPPGPPRPGRMAGGAPGPGGAGPGAPGSGAAGPSADMYQAQQDNLLRVQQLQQQQAQQHGIH